MYIRVLHRISVFYLGSMIFAIATCVTFILPSEIKRLPHKSIFKEKITEEAVLYLTLRNLQILGPLLLAIGAFMLFLGCCSKSLEHRNRRKFADLFDSEIDVYSNSVIDSEEGEELENRFQMARMERLERMREEKINNNDNKKDSINLIDEITLANTQNQPELAQKTISITDVEAQQNFYKGPSSQQDKDALKARREKEFRARIASNRSLRERAKKASNKNQNASASK